MAALQKCGKPSPTDRVCIARCGSCKSVLTNRDAVARNIITTDNAMFHKNHFCCALCDKNLAGQGYTELNNKIICVDCYQEKENPKCSGCGGTISDVAAQLFDITKYYHKDCVKCCVCRNPLIDGKYMMLLDAADNKQVVDYDCYFCAKYKLNKDA